MGSLAGDEIWPLILVCVRNAFCTRRFCFQNEPGQATEWRSWQGMVVITTSDQMIYTVEVNYQIISKINTVALFTAASRKKMFFNSLVALLIWNKAAFYIQNTK